MKWIIVMMALSLSACATVESNRGDVYKRGEARVASSVLYGTVVSTRNVTIEGTRSGIGAGTGAVVGGVAGSSMGGGKGQIITTIAGALLGGLAGQATEEYATTKKGVEIVVQLDNGGTIAVVQEYEMFAAGDKVKVIRQNNVTRVAH